MFEYAFTPMPEKHTKREKRKAQELRRSQWWKNQKGKNTCYYCKGQFKSKELTMDHIVPIIRGGFTKKSNVITACKQCNSEKKYLLPIEWQRNDKNNE